MSSTGTCFNYGIHFWMYLQSSSQVFCWVQGLNIRKYGAASVPLPAAHCHPPEFCIGEQSTNLVAKYFSPSCQSKKRSFAKKEDTIILLRLCIHPETLSWRMAASTMGKPVCPVFHASRCFYSYFHFISSNFYLKDFPCSTFGKQFVTHIQNQRQCSSFTRLLSAPRAPRIAWYTSRADTVVKWRCAESWVVGSEGLLRDLLQFLNFFISLRMVKAALRPGWTANQLLCSKRVVSCDWAKLLESLVSPSQTLNLNLSKGSGLDTVRLFRQQFRKGVNTWQGFSLFWFTSWPLSIGQSPQSYSVINWTSSLSAQSEIYLSLVLAKGVQSKLQPSEPILNLA